MRNQIKTYFSQYRDASTLAFFRLAFGVMMFLGLVRFAWNGWISEFYIKPSFHFTYFGFEWVRPFGQWTYLLFLICGLAALGVAAGYKYRWSIITFFLTFTYIELMDKTTYLNHYYFVSVVSFAMIFLPAAATYSVDALQNPRKAFARVPAWTIDTIKILLSIVYFYAGLAKINSDWLFKAMPLKIWLANNYDLPFIGSFLNTAWLQYTFSWTGMIYDLAIPFLLFYRRTRVFAFVLVVVFHVLTRILFPIGLFPFIMIVSTLIFFDSRFHKNVLRAVCRFFSVAWGQFENGRKKTPVSPGLYSLRVTFIALFLIVQLVFPFRYLFYPGELFWTEEGFRFSWRVMLMEKAGYAQFKVADSETGHTIYVNNSDFLTTFQEKQMSFQPDFMLEYAHFLHDYYKTAGLSQPIVTVDSYVALNGRLSKRFINPEIDLAKQQESFRPKTWILPFNDDIKGL
jgi:hypothetical protein